MTISPWKHITITAVLDGHESNCWFVGTENHVVGIPKEKCPEEPQIGDTMSVIAVGSLVIALAIGEHLLWDDRAKAG